MALTRIQMNKKSLSRPSRKPTEKQQQILKLKVEHPDLSTRQLGKLCNSSHTHVVATLNKYGVNAEEVEEFKKHKADILAGLQARILSTLTDDDIKKAPMGSRVLAVAQLYDKERLERGQSTLNLAHIHEDIAALREAEKDNVPVYDTIDV